MSHKMIGGRLAEENLVIFPDAPRRYTVNDWNFNNRVKRRIAEDQQQLANRVILESERLIDETRNSTKQFKKEVDYRLNERLINIKFLRDESQKQKTDASKEEEALKTYRKRILNAIEALEEKAEVICSKCIILRENRLLVDMVDDEVDRELRQELTVIKGCQNLLKKSLAETTEQIRRIRAIIYLLDRDLSNKEKSLQIDELNLNLRENQMEMHIYEGKIPLDPYNSTSTEWEEATHKNIQNTAKELNSAKPLRSYIDILLKQVVEDLRNQISRTDESFQKRISEMTYAKDRLEVIHNETALQVNKLTLNITKLEKELAEKEGFVVLTQMRLANRAQRPGLELCQDLVQDTLINELNTLKMTIGRLQVMIAEANATLRYLLSTQMLQEEEINTKTNSLKIDEVDCVTLRQGLDIQSF